MQGEENTTALVEEGQVGWQTVGGSRGGRGVMKACSPRVMVSVFNV